MAISNSMKFKLYTLVDITQSGERKGPNKVAVGQQTNWDTLIQVIGLRANPEPLSIIEKEENIKELQFGSNYKGKQKYWIFEFEMPEGSTSIAALESDFNLIPFISKLTETFEDDIDIFVTNNDKRCNIFFN
jgi:hypothetical protein